MIRQFKLVILLLVIASVAIPAVSAELLTMHPASAPDGIVTGDASAVRIVSITYYVGDGNAVRKGTLVPDPNVTLVIPLPVYNVVLIKAKVKYTGPDGTLGMGYFYENTPTIDFHDSKLIPAGKSITLSSDGIFQTTAGGRLFSIEAYGNNKSLVQWINVIFS